ncbi:MAG: glycosyl transferase group 1 [Mucilaginibacter sp.]|nr:glycosyl transferase group 1 [Mucilaginibacter sp.]
MKAIKTNNTLVRVTTVPISLEKLISGQMRFLSEQGFEVYMISSDYEQAKFLEEKENGKYVPVNMTRTISPVKDLLSLVKMILVFRRIKPIIVHTHTPKAGLIGMIAAWLTRVPIRLHTVAGLPLMESTGAKRRLLEMVEKITYFCASMVYPNSYELKEFILNSKFCKTPKLKVIGNGSSNGIDTDFYKLTPQLINSAGALRAKYNISESDFIFIFVGRLVKDKGIEELVDAFADINILYPDTRLLLVGGTEPDLDPLSFNCIKQIEENSKIISVGYQSDVRKYFAISNALVFPSYREGFPNVPMQAGCFNLPCIVTNINGCNEIIEDEKNGLIIPVKDTEELKVAMERMMNDKLLYLQLKESARKMIIDRYEQSDFWFLLLDEYHTHLKEHGFLLPNF